MLKISLSLQERKVIFLSSLGGALEFYDFIIYVFFASTLSQLFFPTTNHLASLMGIFAVFAIGYLIRPLGGVIFSHFGDKYGRKKMFISTLILMALPTFLIGLLPTSEQIGIGAPILLIFLRILQGLSLGGEIPGAITFAGEHVNPAHRGLTCAIIFFGINTGMLLGSAISTALTIYLSPEQILIWGWRIPFILGGLLGIVSFYLRKRMTETPVFRLFLQEISQPKMPIIEAFRCYLPQLIQAIALIWLGAVIVCLLFLYLPTYLSSILHYPKESIEALNTLNILLLSFVLVGIGWLSDIFGRRLFLLLGSSAFILFGYLLFFLLTQHHMTYVIGVMIMFSLCGACIIGVYPATIIELFPTQIRYTGTAVAYNIAFAVFGGLSPLLATYLIHQTNNILSPSFYLIISALACFLAALPLRNKHAKSLS